MMFAVYPGEQNTNKHEIHLDKRPGAPRAVDANPGSLRRPVAIGVKYGGGAQVTR